MKKISKIYTSILASAMLILPGLAFLASNTINQQNMVLRTDQAVNNVQRVSTVTNISLRGSANWGSNFAIVKTTEGERLYGWGMNGSGELGVGDNVNKSTPTLVQIPDFLNTDKITDVSAGRGFTLVLVNNNRLYSCGANGSGQLGLGSDVTSKNVFTRITASNISGTITSISSLGTHALAIANNKLYAWGSNGNSELGLGTTTPMYTPTQVTSSDWTSGTLTQVKTGYSISSVMYNGLLYIWGRNKYGTVGNNTTQNVIRPYKSTLTNISLFELTSTSLAVSNGNLYGWGENVNSQLGNNVKANVHTPTLLSKPAGTITDLHAYCDATMFRIGNKIYGAGKNAYGELGVGDNSPRLTYTAMNFTLTNDAIWVNNYDGNLIYMNGSIYAWGKCDAYQYGNGESKVYNAPTKVDTFSTPSKLTPKVQDNTSITATDALASFNNGGTINLIAFNKYVDGTSLFPTDKVLTIKGTPVINKTNETIQMTVTASKSYNQDGAKTIKAVDFPITISGFKKQYLNSGLVYKTAPAAWNSSNIQSTLKQTSGIAKKEELTKIIDLEYFPSDATFTIAGDSLDLTRKSYKGNITVNKYYESGIQKNTSKTYAFEITGFLFYDDSKVTIKWTPSNTKYNLSNISELLGTTSVNMANLLEVVNLLSFPENTTYTISGVSVIETTGVYSSTLTPSKYYLNGLLYANTTAPKKTFPIVVTGLKLPVGDSQVITKANLPANIYTHNIQSKLNSSGVLNTTVLNQIFDLSSFPSDAIFTINGDTISLVGAKYQYAGNLRVSKYYKTGLLVTTPKDFAFVVMPPFEADSLIAYHSLPADIYTHNIQSELNSSGALNTTVLNQIFDLNSFPSDAVFTINSDTVSLVGDKYQYAGNLRSDKSYKSGILVTAPTDFAFVVTPPFEADSLIAYHSLPVNIYTHNIQSELNSSGVLNTTVLNQIFDLSSFPSDAVFTINGDTVSLVGDKYQYAGNLRANKSYKSGLLVTAPTDFAFVLTPPFVADSLIAYHSLPANIYTHNIQSELNSSGVLNTTILNQIFDLSSFPSDAVFTINGDTVSLVGDKYQYAGNLRANKSYKSGLLVTAPTDFAFVLTPPFKANTAIVYRQLPANLYSHEIKLLINPSGGTADRIGLDKIINVALFPDDAALSIINDSVTIDSGNVGHYTSNLVANKYYENGLLVNASKTFNLQVDNLLVIEGSSIKYKDLPADLNIRNIGSSLVDSDGQINLDLLAKIIDLSKFPEGTIFKIDVSKIIADEKNNIFSLPLEVNQYFENGSVVQSSKTYDIRVEFPMVFNYITITIISVSMGTIVLFSIISGMLVSWKRRKAVELAALTDEERLDDDLQIIKN